MSRTRVRRRRVVAIAAVAVIGGLSAGTLARDHGSGVRPAAAHRYVVRDGDTVWSIAGRLERGSDPRPLVDAIVSTNHIDPSSLRPGQTLLVPAA